MTPGLLSLLNWFSPYCTKGGSDDPQRFKHNSA